MAYLGRKKLYREGAQTEGVVVKFWDNTANTQNGDFGAVIRAKFPDGSTAEFKQRLMDRAYVGDLYVGAVVPLRYKPSNSSKITLDLPALRERHEQANAAQQSAVDAEVANLGQPGSQGPGGPAAQALAGLGAGGDLKAKLLQMAAQNPGGVIDLRSSQPQAAQASDPVDRLAKLADLHERGALTDEEFAAEKAKIVGES